MSLTHFRIRHLFGDIGMHMGQMQKHIGVLRAVQRNSSSIFTASYHCPSYSAVKARAIKYKVAGKCPSLPVVRAKPISAIVMASPFSRKRRRNISATCDPTRRYSISGRDNSCRISFINPCASRTVRDTCSADKRCCARRELIIKKKIITVAKPISITLANMSVNAFNPPFHRF